MFSLGHFGGENNLELEGIESGALYGESWLWVQLTCSGITCEICYEHDGQDWNYLTGDDEPPMPDDILKRWHGREGDKLLDRVWEDLL